MALSTSTSGDPDLIAAVEAGLEGYPDAILHTLGVVQINLRSAVPVRYALFGCTRTSTFSVHSPTKTMIGHVFADMVNHGAIDQYDTVGSYLPLLTSTRASVTLRQLATHTGGFHNSPDNSTDFQEWLANAIATGDAIYPIGYSLEQLCTHAEENQNTEWIGANHYSGIGTALLLQALAAAADTTIYDLMAQFFRRVGMVNTFIPQSLADLPANTVPHFTGAELVPQQQPLQYAGAGRGGVYSTLTDMGRWLTSILLGTAPGMHAARRQLASDDSLGYAWYVAGPPGRPVLNKSGESRGMTVQTVASQHRQIATCLFSNTNDRDMEDLAFTLNAEVSGGDDGEGS